MTYGDDLEADERIRFKDNKGRIWEYEDIDKLEPWELAWKMENMDLYVDETEGIRKYVDEAEGIRESF